jgi:hypothetical protein
MVRYKEIPVKYIEPLSFSYIGYEYGYVKDNSQRRNLVKLNNQTIRIQDLASDNEGLHHPRRINF